MTAFKRSQAKYVKKSYKTTNWPEYEAGLRQRGSLTVWISEDELKGWGPPKRGQRKPGGQERYSNRAIETALTVGMVFHLGLRQTEGFLGSLFSLLDLDCQAPDHTTISRRARKLGKLSICPPAGKRPVHILIDSTGLKIHVGTLRKPPKNRDWRKLHISVDALTGDVIACDLTSKSARDASRVMPVAFRPEPFVQPLKVPLQAASVSRIASGGQLSRGSRLRRSTRPMSRW